jgi:hypothetical protein
LVGVFCEDFLRWEEQRTLKASRFTEAQKTFVLKKIVADLTPDRGMLQDVFGRKI